MGMSIFAAVWVGLPRQDIENQELLEDESLESCPPHYDGNSADDAIAGFELLRSPSHLGCELSFDQSKVEELKVQFKELTGQDAKVWLSPCVW
jgi:hypothetical protein